LSEVTRIVAIRHGETEWNVQVRMQGQLDIGLNANGRWQSNRIALALQGEDVAAVYSSDLARALQTAQPMAELHGLELVHEPGLRERHFGAFEGHSYADIARQWPEENARWQARDAEFGPMGGETLAAFNARCLACARRLAARHRGQQIVLVTHGGVLDCLYRAAAHVALDTPRSWRLGNALINRLLHSDQGFALVGWSDDRHLNGPTRDDHAAGAAPVHEY
jgi:probable phosphoglycerate mutase